MVKKMWARGHVVDHLSAVFIEVTIVAPHRVRVHVPIKTAVTKVEQTQRAIRKMKVIRMITHALVEDLIVALEAHPVPKRKMMTTDRKRVEIKDIRPVPKKCKVKILTVRVSIWKVPEKLIQVLKLRE